MNTTTIDNKNIVALDKIIKQKVVQLCNSSCLITNYKEQNKSDRNICRCSLRNATRSRQIMAACHSLEQCVHMLKAHATVADPSLYIHILVRGCMWGGKDYYNIDSVTERYLDDVSELLTMYNNRKEDVVKVPKLEDKMDAAIESCFKYWKNARSTVTVDQCLADACKGEYEQYWGRARKTEQYAKNMEIMQDNFSKINKLSSAKKELVKNKRIGLNCTRKDCMFKLGKSEVMGDNTKKWENWYHKMTTVHVLNSISLMSIVNEFSSVIGKIKDNASDIKELFSQLKVEHLYDIHDMLVMYINSAMTDRGDPQLQSLSGKGPYFTHVVNGGNKYEAAADLKPATVVSSPPVVKALAPPTSKIVKDCAPLPMASNPTPIRSTTGTSATSTKGKYTTEQRAQLKTLLQTRKVAINRRGKYRVDATHLSYLEVSEADRIMTFYDNDNAFVKEVFDEVEAEKSSKASSPPPKVAKSSTVVPSTPLLPPQLTRPPLGPVEKITSKKVAASSTPEIVDAPVPKVSAIVPSTPLLPPQLARSLGPVEKIISKKVAASSTPEIVDAPVPKVFTVAPSTPLLPPQLARSLGQVEKIISKKVAANSIPEIAGAPVPKVSPILPDRSIADKIISDIVSESLSVVPRITDISPEGNPSGDIISGTMSENTLPWALLNDTIMGRFTITHMLLILLIISQITMQYIINIAIIIGLLCVIAVIVLVTRGTLVLIVSSLFRKCCLYIGTKLEQLSIDASPIEVKSNVLNSTDAKTETVSTCSRSTFVRRKHTNDHTTKGNNLDGIYNTM